MNFTREPFEPHAQSLHAGLVHEPRVQSLCMGFAWTFCEGAWGPTLACPWTRWWQKNIMTLCGAVVLAGRPRMRNLQASLARKLCTLHSRGDLVSKLCVRALLAYLVCTCLKHLKDLPSVVLQQTGDEKQNADRYDLDTYSKHTFQTDRKFFVIIFSLTNFNEWFYPNSAFNMMAAKNKMVTDHTQMTVLAISSKPIDQSLPF